MSNLGFQSVYSLLNNRPDTLCERFFLPDAEDLAEHRKTGYPLFSLESGHYLTDFDVIAFSISFENDYLNLPTLFELARIPLFAEERGDNFPPLLAGGVCAFLNPEPLAEIMDLFAVGEAEALLPDLLPVLVRRVPAPGTAAPAGAGAGDLRPVAIRHRLPRQTGLWRRSGRWRRRRRASAASGWPISTAAKAALSC